ncbi:MAG: FecR domain-containing protein [Spirosomataceae bacterium]
MEPFDNRQELIQIFQKYLDGNATPEEQRFVEAWYESFGKDAGITDSYTEEQLGQMEARMEYELKKRMEASRPRPLWKSLHRLVTPSRVAAAVFLILSLAGAWYIMSNQGSKETMTDESTLHAIDLPPGSDQGILTLTDGSQIVLGSVSTGMLARQGNTLIQKIEDGLVAYTGEDASLEPGLNTLTVPSGGKYSLVLPDGSRVWLNAESSITFPTAFSGRKRSVKISGEVYFDVAKDPDRPFIVQVGNNRQIRVLGTQFNVNAYSDEEEITTTLLEGSVEILPGGNAGLAVRLKPGEQAAFSETGQISVRHGVNTDEIVAWKNGMFHFEKADIQSVMRQISRWYNVEVVYEGPLPNRSFSGKIDRQSNASEALDILRFTGLNFRIDALPDESRKGKITVLP